MFYLSNLCFLQKRNGMSIRAGSSLTCLSLLKTSRWGGLCLAWIHVEGCDGTSLTWSRIAL